MPLHDWTRVSPGTYHGFHSAWITELARLLNNGLLPKPFYAEAEQVAGDTGPDVPALEAPDEPPFDADENVSGQAKVAVLSQLKPVVTLTQTASEAEVYCMRRNRLAVRHTSGDRLIAYLELVSSGNKASRRALDRLLDKVYSVLDQGIHLLVVDPYPPGIFDSQGIHGAIWNEIDPLSEFTFPDERRRTAVSYHALHPPVAYVEPLALGACLPLMPLFLDTQRYVNVPLETAYSLAFEAIPKRYRDQLTEGLTA